MSNGGRPAFPHVCVVGLGNHARTKLIPAVLANGQKVVGLVSTQPSATAAGARRFEHLADALEALPQDTLFILSSPPAAHFQQVMSVIASGRDVIVEKPAFVTPEQAVDAFAAANARGTVLVEAFMHRHTECYRHALALWRERRADISAIDIVFTIPAVPGGTFRSQSDIGSSSLYDIGCYGLSLLDDLGLPLNAIRLGERASAGPDRDELLCLDGEAAGVAATIEIGVARDYVNKVAFTTHAGDTTSFAPFFYGRPGERLITSIIQEETTRVVLDDRNAFEAMFAVSRDDWLASQDTRRRGVISVTQALDRLGAGLLEARLQP